MLKQLSSLCLAAVCLALPGSSQGGSCSTLSATVLLDPILPVQTVAIDVLGTTPVSPVVLAISTNTGTTNVNLRALGILTLGLQAPYTATFLGMSDMKGDLQRQYRFRTGFNVSRFLQTVTISATSTTPSAPLLCTSNVVQLDLL
jgi:hypothetical protein